MSQRLASAVAAAIAVPSAAFVPSVSQGLRSSSVAPQHGEAASSSTLAAISGVTPVAGFAALGLAAAGVAAIRGTRGARAAKVSRSAAGVCLPLTEKWDPLNLGSTDSKMDRYTQVEIKHGRVSMIACVGYIMPELFRFPGCENFGHGLSALGSIPPEGWFQLVGFLGLHEVLVKPRESGMGPYDFGLGVELLDGIPEEELERRQTVERNNGRLAMVAIMGLMVQDGMFGTTPIQLIKQSGWWGTPVDYLIKNIPICSGYAGCALKRPATRGPGLTATCATVYKDLLTKPFTLPPPKMSPSVPFLKSPKVLEGWVGGEKGFDPLGVTDALPVYIVREAELKHGRVCMLATLGWIATDLGVRFPSLVFQDVTTLEAHDKFVANGYMGIFLGFLATVEIYSGWLLLQGFEGIIPREAGDFFLGKNFLPKDEEGAKTMKLKELENGRLAMLAFSGIVTQAALFPDKTWPFF